MTKLKHKVNNALSETRTLILGAQILLGFQFEAAFQPGFERLSAHGRALDVGGLVLMMAAVGLLIAPCSFHRLSERSGNTRRTHGFTTRMAESALVPFALCIGVDIFIVAELLFGTAAGGGLAVLLTGLAFFFWYALELARRDRGASDMVQDGEDSETTIDEKIKTLMTEIRVILPGAQALLGFQFASFLSEGFEKLSETAKLVHFASLAAVALSTILLMAPAAYHRIVAGGEDREDVDRLGSRMMLASLVPLAIGLCGEFYVVAGKIGYAGGAALAAALLAFILFMGLWFVYPLARHGRRESADRGRGRTGDDARQQL